MAILAVALNLPAAARPVGAEEWAGLNWRSRLGAAPKSASPAAVPPHRKLTPLQYGADESTCREEGDFLYDLSTEDITLAARCHKISLDGSSWIWVVDTIATFSEKVESGKPSALRPAAFHDVEGCRRYGGAAAKLSTDYVALTYACDREPQPGGASYFILSVFVTLR